MICEITVLGATLDDFVNHNLYRGANGSYGCNFCEYINNNRYNVKTHIETNHAPNSLKTSLCTICDYMCPSRSALRMHLKNKH